MELCANSSNVMSGFDNPDSLTAKLFSRQPKRKILAREYCKLEELKSSDKSSPIKAEGVAAEGVCAVCMGVRFGGDADLEKRFNASSCTLLRLLVIEEQTLLFDLLDDKRKYVGDAFNIFSKSTFSDERIESRRDNEFRSESFCSSN